MNKSSKNSLAHTRWECKYHIVFAPKYRRQIIYRQIKADVGKIVRELCERNRNNRGRMLSGSYTHVGEDTAKIQCVGNNGILEGEKFSMIFDRHANLKYKYGNRNFWCRGYYVDTVGKNAKKFRST